MISSFFKVDEQQIFSQLLEDSPNEIKLIYFIGVNNNIVQIYNNVNIQLLDHDLVDVAPKPYQSVE